MSFNQNAPATESSNIFGLPFAENDSQLVLVPVPWDATVSYGHGAAKGPETILEASKQVDLYDPSYPDFWQAGIAMLKAPKQISTLNMTARKAALKQISALTRGKKSDNTALKVVNKASEQLNQWLEDATLELLEQGRQVGIVGGDHSVPLGFLRALAQHNSKFGILQFDAHMDLRQSYEGFQYSHASIMYEALKLKEVTKLVQVGIRDLCEAESEYVRDAKGRVQVFLDSEIQRAQFIGKNFKQITDAIIKTLPKDVYLSFDIDGLDPALCPGTGTPVPGGLSFQQAVFILERLVESGKKVIGFDLCEVSPKSGSDWDANVGARMLFKLCAMALCSN